MKTITIFFPYYKNVRMLDEQGEHIRRFPDARKSDLRLIVSTMEQVHRRLRPTGRYSKGFLHQRSSRQNITTLEFLLKVIGCSWIFDGTRMLVGTSP